MARYLVSIVIECDEFQPQVNMSGDAPEVIDQMLDSLTKDIRFFGVVKLPEELRKMDS